MHICNLREIQRLEKERESGRGRAKETDGFCLVRLIRNKMDPFMTHVYRSVWISEENENEGVRRLEGVELSGGEIQI